MLSSWQSHCENSPSSSDECRTVSTLRLSLPTWTVSLPLGCYHLHPPWLFGLTQPDRWYSFYHLTGHDEQKAELKLDNIQTVQTTAKLAYCYQLGFPSVEFPSPTAISAVITTSLTVQWEGQDDTATCDEQVAMTQRPAMSRSRWHSDLRWERQDDTANCDENVKMTQRPAQLAMK